MKRNPCQCYDCLDDPSLGIRNPILLRMIVCEVCGNKRCPKATDHRNECTNSNEPKQPGSIYGGLEMTHLKRPFEKIQKVWVVQHICGQLRRTYSLSVHASYQSARKSADEIIYDYATRNGWTWVTDFEAEDGSDLILIHEQELNK